MLFLPYMREKMMKPKVDDNIKFYQSIEKNKISEYQMTQFNKIWQVIQRNVPFYKDLIEKKEVPSTITNWVDFNQLPIVDRSYAKEHIEEFADKTREPDAWVSTGGSTGTPLKYPSWKTEAKYYESNVWYAREFYNILRSDRMFRIWGHSHTLGTGLSRYKKIFTFKIGLPLIGYKRFSAYDLSHEQLKKAGEQIIQFKPDYIIGYSKALYMLARANVDRMQEFHQLNLKAVIGAAEGFEKDEDKDFISEVFGCSVGLEYASMETKLLAHTHPKGGYRVLWRDNLVECVDDEGNPSDNGRILVTSLYPRAFPLIRYELGDRISGTNKDSNSVHSFAEVAGRNNDFLMLDKDTPIHSEAITHAIKFSDKIIAYQIRYTSDSEYTIYVKSNSNISEEDINEIRSRLDQIDKRLSTLKIVEVDKLKQTRAGKIRWLIEE